MQNVADCPEYLDNVGKSDGVGWGSENTVTCASRRQLWILSKEPTLWKEENQMSVSIYERSPTRCVLSMRSLT